jgi:hypothetical protein
LCSHRHAAGLTLGTTPPRLNHEQNRDFDCGLMI